MKNSTQYALVLVRTEQAIDKCRAAGKALFCERPLTASKTRVIEAIVTNLIMLEASIALHVLQLLPAQLTEKTV
jgi:hypothetical protein